MRLKSLIAGILACFGLMAYSHPLHLTFTNLEFKTQNSHWVLTIKVFSDDFAANLMTTTGTESMAGKNSKSDDVNQILKKWLENRLVIWFDSKLIEFDTWEFDGIRVKDDASWLTFTFTAPLPVSEIKVRNALLLDLYSDQKNLFVLSMGQFQSAQEFKNKNQETIIKLNK